MRKIPFKVLFASLFLSGCDIRPATTEEAAKAGDFIKQVITFASLEGIPSNEKKLGVGHRKTKQS